MTDARFAVCGYGQNTGYGTAATRVCAALQRVGNDALWVLIEQRGVADHWQWLISDPELEARPSPIDDVGAVIAQLPPDHCVDLRQRVPTKRMILSTVWETDQLPSEWAGHLTADAFVVPTEWNAVLFRERGLRNVHVIPHAVDPSPSTAHAPLPIEIGPDTFVFYVINTWSERKAMDDTLGAYLRAFTGADDVLFVIKTEVSTGDYVWPKTPTWKRVMDGVRTVPNPPAVRLVTDLWTSGEIAALHRRGDCYLSLTHGEGWGLGIFDAVLAENAVITTGWGAPAEYLGHHAGLVPFALAPARFHPVRSYGNWANASVDEAVDRMRAAYRDRGARLSADSRASAEALRSRCSLEAVGNAFVKICDESA